MTDDLQLNKIIKNILYDNFPDIISKKLNDIKEQIYNWGFPQKWSRSLVIRRTKREEYQCEITNFITWDTIRMYSHNNDRYKFSETIYSESMSYNELYSFRKFNYSIY